MKTLSFNPSPEQNVFKHNCNHKEFFHLSLQFHSFLYFFRSFSNFHTVVLMFSHSLYRKQCQPLKCFPRDFTWSMHRTSLVMHAVLKRRYHQFKVIKWSIACNSTLITPPCHVYTTTVCGRLQPLVFREIEDYNTKKVLLSTELPRPFKRSIKAAEKSQVAEDSLHPSKKSI